MTPTAERGGNGSWVGRFLRGALPILICVVFLSMAPPSSARAIVGVCAASAIILWFEWTSMRRSGLTRWAGVILSLFLGLILVLFLLGIVIRISLFLLPVFLLALPLLLYDLLFRAPSKGMAESDHVEPSHLGS